MADPKNKWSQPAAPPGPMFFGKKERELVKQVNDELAERVIGQAVAYYPISLEESNFNTTYGEAVEKVSLPPVRVYAYVVVENEQSNEKYGYEYTNKLTVNFHRARLTADQDLYVRVGDYLQYGEKFYEIVKTYNDTRYLFGQVEHKFQISAECVEARPGAFRVEKELTRPTAVSGSSADTSGPAPRSAPYPPLDATYITVAADPKLPNERVLTAGAGITLTDLGAGSTITIAATAGGDGIFTAVSPSAAYTTSSATFGAATTPTDTLTVAGTFSGSGVATFGTSLSSSGDVAVTGNVHAAQFYGGGAGITGISADGVDVTSSTADINYPVVFTEGFQTDGSLGLGGNTAFIYNPSDNIISSSAALQVVGNSIIGGTLNVSGNTRVAASASIGSAAQLGQLYVSGAHSEAMLRIDGLPNGPGNTGRWLTLTGSRGSDGNARVSLGIGTGDPQYALDVNGYISLGRSGGGYILVNDDADTWIRFGHAGSDSMQFNAGGLNFLEFDENGLDIARINPDGVDIDFQVATLGNDYTIFAEGSSDLVGIGTANPSHTLTVAGTLSGSGVVRLASSLSSSGDVAVTGNVHAAQFYGGGGNLTGISADAIDVTSSTGDINYPVVFTEGFQTDGTLGLGGNTGLVYNPNDAVLSSSAGIQAVGATILGSTLNVSGAISGAVGITGSSGIFDVQVSSSAFHGNTAYFSSDVQIAGTLIGGSPLKISGALDIVDDLGNVISGLGASTFSSSAGAMFVQAISSSSDLAVSGNLHATTYYGDGSNLTGIDGVSGSIRIYSSTGLVTTGYLGVSGSSTLAGNATFGQGVNFKRTAVAGNYDILTTDYYLGVDSSINAIGLVLPYASAAGSGKTYIIKDEGGAAGSTINRITVSVDGPSGDTIDGQASVVISSAHGAFSLYSDGSSNWYVC
tara:strand:+ start:3618 stop:6368 length:2751 start_codon:yes stop_codon:yes gene_type:complete